MLPWTGLCCFIYSISFLWSGDVRIGGRKRNPLEAAVDVRYDDLISRHAHLFVAPIGLVGHLVFWGGVQHGGHPWRSTTWTPVCMCVLFVCWHTFTRSVDPARLNRALQAGLFSCVFCIRLCRVCDLLFARDAAALVRETATNLETTYDVLSTWLCFMMGCIAGMLQPREPLAWRCFFVTFMPFSSLLPPALGYGLSGEPDWLYAAVRKLCLPTLFGLLAEGLVRSLLKRVLAHGVRNEVAIALPAMTPPTDGTVDRFAAAVPALASSDSQSTHSLGDFDMLGVLGFGGSAQVRLVRERASGELRALKSVFKIRNGRPINDSQFSRMRAERSILSSVHNHAFVVGLHGAFEDEQCLHLVLEYATQGPLSQWLSGTCGEAQCRFLAAEVTAAIGHLHSHGVIYRDLKPHNILVTSSGHILLADFGVSKKLSADTRHDRPSLVGTDGYIAPEVFSRLSTGSTAGSAAGSTAGSAAGSTAGSAEGGAGGGVEVGHSFPVDWWSLGVLVHGALTDDPDGIGVGTLHEVMAGSREVRQQFAAQRVSQAGVEMSESARDFVIQLLAFDPADRLGTAGGASEVKAHPFFTSIDWEKLDQLALPPPFPELKLMATTTQGETGASQASPTPTFGESGAVSSTLRPRNVLSSEHGSPERD